MASETTKKDSAKRGEQFWLLLVAVVVVPALLFVVLASLSRASVLRDAENRLRQTTEILLQQATAQFEVAQQMIGRVDERYRGLSKKKLLTDEPEIHRYLETLQQQSGQSVWLWIIAKDGYGAASSDLFPLPREAQAGDRDYFLVHEERDDAGLFVSRPVRGRPYDGAINFVLSQRRSAPDGSFDGIVIAIIPTDYLVARWSALDEGLGSTTGLVRDDGAVIVRYPRLTNEQTQIPPDSDFAKLILRSNEGIYTTVSSLDGRERIVAFKKLPGFPVQIAHSVELEKVLGAWRSLLWIYGLLCGAASIGLIAITLVARRRALGERVALVGLRQQSERRAQAEGSLRRAHMSETAQQAVRERERQLRLFTEAAPVAIAMFDREMRYVAVSRRFREDYGLGERDLIGHSHYEIFPEISERWRDIHRRCLAGAVEKCEEDRFERTDGAIDWIRWEIQPWYLAPGAVGGIILFSEDITARKHAETALRQTEEQLRFLADRAPVFLARCDTDYRYLFVSTGFAARLNRRIEDIVGRRISEVIGEEAFARIKSKVDATLAGRSAEFEVDLPYEGVGRRYMHCAYVPEYDDHGRVCGVIGVMTDLTARRQAEEALRRSEEHFRHLADAMPQIAWTARPDGYVDYYNRRWYEFTGAEEGKGGDESWLPILHPDDVQRCLDLWYRAVRTGELYEIEYRLIDRNTGRYRWHLGRALPVRDEQGQIVKWFGAATDIDDLRSTREALRMGEARFRAAVQAVSGILWTNNAAGEMEGEQPGWSSLTGQSYEEYRGFGWSKAVHPDDAQPTIDAWNDAVAQRKSFVFEHRVRRYDGAWRLFAVRAIPAFNPDGSIREWVGVHTDITEERQTREDLRQLNDTLEQRVAARTAELEAAMEERRKIEGALQQSQRLEGHRSINRRRRPRLQQFVDRRRRPDRKHSDGRDRQRAHYAHGRRRPARRRAWRAIDEPIAGLRPASAAPPGNRCRSPPHRQYRRSRAACRRRDDPCRPRRRPGSLAVAGGFRAVRVRDPQSRDQRARCHAGRRPAHHRRTQPSYRGNRSGAPGPDARRLCTAVRFSF